MMHPLEVLAGCFRYPEPGRAEELAAGVGALPERRARRSLERFLGAVQPLPLSGWEELHTRTLELAPLVHPYVGFVKFGESYRRGEFMSDMNQALLEAGVPLRGELPDHLDPVLRYLARVDDPLPALVEIVVPTVVRMRDTLRQVERRNPYVHALQAVARTLPGFVPELADADGPADRGGAP